MFTSVILLIITGMPLKFPAFVLSRFLVNLGGGFHNSTIVHRIGAGMLIYFMVHHLFYTVLSRQGRRDFVLLIPTPKDARDLVQNIRHFLGKVPEKPRFGRFSYIEKFDYWAVYWGCVIMIGSGLFLWGESIALKYFPKYILDVAHEMHSDEAMLATLAIVIWHFYNVHFNPDRVPGTLIVINGAFFVSAYFPRSCVVCHYMDPYYDQWKTSRHANVSCIKCHSFSPVFITVTTLTYWTGLYHPRPRANVPDRLCLSSGCHEGRIEKGEAKLGGITFDHQEHMTKLKRGEKLRCTSCHYSIVQGEHVAVDTNVCFLCHFKGISQGQALGGCPGCHGTPTRTVGHRGVTFSPAHDLQ